MKYKFYLLYILLPLFLLSCGSKMPFDPRAYNGSIIDNTTPEIEPDIPQVDKDNDPFLFPENNNPNAGGFNASKFNEWTLYTYFDGENVARHEFRNDKNWTPGDVSKGEYKLSGQSTYTEVVNPPVNKINDVTYYMYKGKNDHFLPDSDYNTKPINHVVRMERFVFFRFTGSPLAGDALDNRFMAIDTMTKLIFAYSKPTEFKDILGHQVPTKWEPVDNATKVLGVSYPFYEYDPIGVAHPDGTVELFPQYVTDTENGYYDPRIDIVNADREVASPNKPGRSPYIVFNSNLKFYEFSIKAKSLKNINIKSDKYINLGSFFKPNWQFISQNEAYLNYAIRSSLYADGNAITYDVLSHKKNGEIMTSGLFLIKDTTDTIVVNGIKNFTDIPNKYPIVSTEIEKYNIELDAVVTKYGYSLGGFVELKEKWTMATYNNYGAPSIKFVYDKDKEAFVLDKSKSILNKTTVTEPFELKVGETKDFAINYNNESEITYTLSLE